MWAWDQGPKPKGQGAAGPDTNATQRWNEGHEPAPSQPSSVSDMADDGSRRHQWGIGIHLDVEENIKKAVEAATKMTIVGISIAWKYQDKQESIENACTKDLYPRAQPRPSRGPPEPGLTWGPPGAHPGSTQGLYIYIYI